MSDQPASSLYRLRAYAMECLKRTPEQPGEAVSFSSFVAARLGVEVTTRPVVFCVGSEATVRGETVMFSLPESIGGGVAVLVFNEAAMRMSWAEATAPMVREDLLMRVLREDAAWAAESVRELALDLFGFLIDENDEMATRRTGGKVSLNWADPVWALAHVRTLITGEEVVTYRSAAYHDNDPAGVVMVVQRVRAAMALQDNVYLAEEARGTLLAAADLYPAGVPDEVLAWAGERLLHVPRAQWAEAAESLLAEGLARL